MHDRQQQLHFSFSFFCRWIYSSVAMSTTTNEPVTCCMGTATPPTAQRMGVIKDMEAVGRMGIVGIVDATPPPQPNQVKQVAASAASLTAAVRPVQPRFLHPPLMCPRRTPRMPARDGAPMSSVAGALCTWLQVEKHFEHL